MSARPFAAADHLSAFLRCQTSPLDVGARPVTITLPLIQVRDLLGTCAEAAEGGYGPLGPAEDALDALTEAADAAETDPG